jgi:UDP-N-acetylmuramoylalanine--D-glutamate ligase
MKINLVHKNIAILGFGKEWQSTLRFLQKNGINDYNIAVFDRDETLVIPEFKGKVISWENYLAYLDQYDFIFKSPGISPYTHNLKRFWDKILTQTKLFYEFYKWKIISVTQTKGKSTTTTLVYELLKNAWYNVKIVGNIGNPVLDEIDIQKDQFDYVVYELSSYMLEELDNHHSFISILWNIYPDHLDWHLNFKNYSQTKQKVLLNSDNILVWYEWFWENKKALEYKNFQTFWENWADISHIWTNYQTKNIESFSLTPKIPWNHNLNNFAAVLWVAEICWVSKEVFIQTIENFSWLPHRLQEVGIFDGKKFIDDAISTTPESTIEWIKSFWSDIETIFLWWTDRWYEFDGLVKVLEEYNIKNIVLFPPSWEKIKSLLDESYNILETSDMQEAVLFGIKNTKKWKICLLSTASPSYSVWKNFEEKWDLFQYHIKNYYDKSSNKK